MGVSVPYEITLLSNPKASKYLIVLVSVPYEITLLSNLYPLWLDDEHVSVPYEITLLSNLSLENFVKNRCFSTL